MAAPSLAHGQAAAPWSPSRPLRFVVPFPAGGATDVAARILAERLTEALGQPVVVENRTGSSGNIGVENVVRSAPDGHTLLMGTSGALTVNPHLFSNLGFDPARALAQKLSDQLGQPVVVENRGGAGGNLGADAVAKAPPGGHTLLLIDAGILATVPASSPACPSTRGGTSPR